MRSTLQHSLGHLMFWKLVVTVFAFLVALKIASAAFQFFLGDGYPAWTMIVALVIVCPVVFLLWRDRPT